MTKDLYFAGVNLRTEYGVKISGSGTFDSPVRGYESVQVPGRSGDILLPEKRLENVVITYPAFIAEDFDANFAGLRAFLLSKIGYQRIEDGYHPDEYRLGYYQGALVPKMARNLKTGQFDLKFVCKRCASREGRLPPQSRDESVCTLHGGVCLCICRRSRIHDRHGL